MSQTASYTTVPTASSNNAAPVPGHGGLSRTSVVALVAVPIGFFVVAIIACVIFCSNGRSARLFRRSATPLSDAEFDEWRRPDKNTLSYHSRGTTIYKSSGLRYDRESKEPKISTVRALRIDSVASLNEKQAPLTTPPPQTAQNHHSHSQIRQQRQQSYRSASSYAQSPHSSIKPLIRTTSVPSADIRDGHKSSLSLQDRPPTPFSPTFPPSRRESDTLWREEAPTSPREPRHRVHLSDASEYSEHDFPFGSPNSHYSAPFGYGPDAGSSPRRDSARRESWVHHSRRFSSLSGIAHPNAHDFRLLNELGEGRKTEYS